MATAQYSGQRGGSTGTTMSVGAAPTGGTAQCGSSGNAPTMYQGYRGDPGSVHQRDPPPYPGHYDPFYDPGKSVLLFIHKCTKI